MGKKSDLNGKVLHLAEALKDVFEGVMEPIHDEIKSVHERIGTMDERINTTNKNMEAQFDQVRKDFRKEFKDYRGGVSKELKKHGVKVDQMESKMNEVLVIVKGRAPKKGAKR